MDPLAVLYALSYKHCTGYFARQIVEKMRLQKGEPYEICTTYCASWQDNEAVQYDLLYESTDIMQMLSAAEIANNSANEAIIYCFARKTDAQTFKNLSNVCVITLRFHIVLKNYGKA